MGLRRKKPTDLSTKKSGTNLTREDLAIVLKYVRAMRTTEADVLRMLVHEALLARKQRNEVERGWNDKHRQQMREGDAEEMQTLKEGLAEMHKKLLWQSHMFDRVLQQSCYGAGLALRNIQLSQEVALIVRKDVLGMTLRAEGHSDEEIKEVRKELREAAHKYGHEQLSEVQEMYLDEIGKWAASPRPGEV